MGPRVAARGPAAALATLAALAAALGGAPRVARADGPSPSRKVAVLEFRAGSSALPGIGKRVVTLLGQQTSLTVLGQDQVRAAFGEQLDQAVFKCAGDAECLARIGGKVGAADVLLVGVSELGDVIMTMQRIVVDGHRVSGRIAESLAAGQTPSNEQLTAYLGRILPAGDFRRFGVIDVVASLAGASVSVGGKRQGVTPLPPLRLPAPASYEIRVERDGFVPFTAQISLSPESALKVRADLSRIGASAPPAWYQRWYVLAAAGVLVAGATGTTIYVLTDRAGRDRVPVTGTIP